MLFLENDLILSNYHNEWRIELQMLDKTQMKSILRFQTWFSRITKFWLAHKEAFASAILKHVYSAGERFLFNGRIPAFSPGDICYPSGWSTFHCWLSWLTSMRLFQFLVACYAFLHPALSVRRLIGRSVIWLVGRSVGWSAPFLLFQHFQAFWAHSSFPNAIVSHYKSFWDILSHY